jgi:AcrR family transcriptional regulator
MVEASHTTIPPASSPSAGQNSPRPGSPRAGSAGAGSAGAGSVGAGATGRSAPRARRAPERTREQILQAAIGEFSRAGLDGARVDTIARRAGANKRMLYHYFGSKDDLFLAVLERIYDDIRHAETALHLEALDPAAAMRRLVEFSFAYFIDHPHFIPLLNSENLQAAQHLKRSRRVRRMHSPFVAMIEGILARGQGAGVFRAGVDPVQLYISIAGLGYFYFSNMHTLSAIFARDLAAPRRLAERKRHAVEVVLGYLRP